MCHNQRQCVASSLEPCGHKNVATYVLSLFTTANYIRGSNVAENLSPNMNIMELTEHAYLQGFVDSTTVAGANEHEYELQEYPDSTTVTDPNEYEHELQEHLDTTIVTEANEPLIPDNDESGPLDTSKTPVALFRKTLWLGFATASTVFLLNTCMLAYALSKSGSITAPAAIYDGHCDTSKRISLAISLFINVLSTLLLGSSNNAAQYLTSPTRAEVDAAHARLSWVDIGIPSLRNLRSIGTTRVVLWSILFCSSFPLHLVSVKTSFPIFVSRLGR